MNTNSLLNFQFVFECEDWTPNEMNEFVRLLRNEIMNIDDVESADFLKGKKPEGTKGLDPVIVSALVIAVLPAATPKLIDALIAIVNRQREQSIKVRVKFDEIEIDVPLSMKPDEAEKWIRKLQQMLKGKKQ